MGVVSKLADGSILCGWEYYKNRDGRKVIGITPHYMAAHWTGKECARYFQNNGISNSANYCIGYNGDLWCNVEEQNAAWTSSSYSNDCSHITIEIGGTAGNVAIIPEEALEKFRQLATDIALRYGIKAYEYTGKAGANFTIHKMFAATPCPGWYFEQKIPELIKDINARIAAGNIYGIKDGWKKEGGKWYYYVSGRKKIGWLTYKKRKYYLDASGVMKTGWFLDGSKWYYASDDGAVLKGWHTIKNKKYLFKPHMITGWYKGTKSWFYFTTKGVYHDSITKRFRPREVIVTADVLNIRDSYTTKADVVGELNYGKIVYITKIKKKDGYTWGLLTDYFPKKDGWIALDFTNYKG